MRDRVISNMCIKHRTLRYNIKKNLKENKIKMHFLHTHINYISLFLLHIINYSC
jgi:hypothetical protein